jgi:hypothetical protein
MSLQMSASNYLKDYPSAWLKFAQALSERLSRRLVEGLPLEKLPFETLSVQKGLADSILAALLLPVEVQLVAGADSESRACERAAECVREALNQDEFDVAELDGEADLDEIVDLSDRGQLVRRWDGSQYHEEDRLLSVRSSLRPLLDDSEILALVRRTAQRGHQRGIDHTTDEAGPSLVRLDLIDIALYRALSEHPELLKTLDWRVFEELLADILKSFGYVVELQRGTKDGGVDIFALRSDQLGEHRYLLQAKRWTNRVGVEPVRQLLFLHNHHRATKSCLATTSVFTNGAWDLASQYKWQLELRDFDGIREWLARAGRLRLAGD